MKYFLVALLVAVANAQAAPVFELVDGDRVVLIGNTFVERDIQYNYLETQLTARYPERNIIFRNLGWSGDTVFVPARAGSGPNKGIDLLVDAVKELRPTVLFIGYGMNESFEGEAGLGRFVDGYNKLLDALGVTKARVVLISPIAHENLGPPLPDPAEHNKMLEMYSEAIRGVADKRGCHFVNLFNPTRAFEQQLRGPFTDNGIHLNAMGYWVTSRLIMQELGIDERYWQLVMKYDGQVSKAEGIQLNQAKAGANGMEFTATYDVLSPPAIPLKVEELLALINTPRAPGGKLSADAMQVLGAAVRPTRLTITDLPRGDYCLKSGGRVLGTSTSLEAAGITLVVKPDAEQVEKLRQAIKEKNVFFFDRYRPQNDMYIFHGRKHEQGRNAVEIPQFDKFIAEKEAEIAKLRVPQKHTYLLEKVR